MRQPTQYGEPLAGRVRPGRQSLVRQRLPRWEVANLIFTQQRPERRRQFLGLARGRGHRQGHRAASADCARRCVRVRCVFAGAGERGYKQRPQRSGRDQVATEGGQLGRLVQRLA